ncbi:hypothetical protein XCR_4395 [Xanthomonas campestris pv. raphani 756C]|nr:hypothetical protein XCR_4395 [Xanthomonas campestris pv. raphani 756C]
MYDNGNGTPGAPAIGVLHRPLPGFASLQCTCLPHCTLPMTPVYHIQHTVPLSIGSATKHPSGRHP